MRTDILSSFIGIAFTALAAEPGFSQAFWINEFHYDNGGTDVGEFIEVAIPASFTDLASIRLSLYNGGDGNPYGASHLLTSFAPGATSSGVTLYSKSISGLQNGSPDGLALDVGGSVTHFISYEGGFTAASGPAAGLTSVDVGFAESDTTTEGSSIGLIGTGLSAETLTWATLTTATPGQWNPGQTPIPEPHEYGLMLGAGLCAFAWRRRHRSRHRSGDPG